MSRAETIRLTLAELSKQDYRQGFNDCVLSHCCDALDAEYPADGRVLWRLMLTGEQNRQRAFEEFFDNNQDLLDYYYEVEERSKGKGAFEMPEWGTRGT